jgi:hypothetical protein
MMWVMGDVRENRRTGPKEARVLTPVMMRRIDSRRCHGIPKLMPNVEEYYGTEGQSEEIERVMWF